VNTAMNLLIPQNVGNFLSNRGTGTFARILVSYIFNYFSFSAEWEYVGYARTNVIGSRSSFVVASVRSSIH
jgi:hypothetical protein